MEKCIPFVLLLVLPVLTFAQTEKGRWSAGTSVGSFTFQSFGSGYSNFYGSLTPTVGHFVANNLLIGAGIPLSFGSSKVNGFKYTSNGIGISPFVRYYFGSSAFKPLAELAVGYNYSHSRREADNYLAVNKSSSLVVSPGVGLAYFINRSISIDAKVSYNWWNSTTKSSVTGASPTEQSNSSDYKNVGLNIGFNIFFGQ